ncbi:MAG: phosphatidate cytidylyltransferase [Lachnospiraceae bacterium]|nr:phosphatidate cytidylyltransferase [Lachnospiraceae bacterium]MDY5742751.1 phosphatidate cytidylyltransferase [Lachnospiraceae bacterium]
MFLTRVKSSAVLVLVVVPTLLLGHEWLYVLLFCAAAIGLLEFYKTTGVQTDEHLIMGAMGYMSAATYYLLLYTGMKQYGLMLILLYLVGVLAVFVLMFPKYSAQQVFAAVIGVVYVPVMMGCIIQLRELPYGIYLVWLIFISSWITDSCAYLAGRAFGRHKLAPILSPKKTIEGAVGGLLGAGLVALIYGLVLQFGVRITLPGRYRIPIVLVVLVVSVVGGVISMLGDLAASGIKRNYDCKDYGNLIPGHGGILDRFDSVIFTAPVIYYLCSFIMK